jgi:pyruvate-formate lyase
MAVQTAIAFTYEQRLKALHDTKIAHTQEKQEIIGSMNHDDWALILPPPDKRKVVQAMSTSGMPITDVLIEGFEPEPNHPSGGFFGPKAVGRNFRRLLEAHPPYVDPMASLAGGYMVNFNSYRKPGWNPDYHFAELDEPRAKYKLLPGIGATQHFCQDLSVGLELGFGGLLDKIRHYRAVNAPRSAEFYDGLEDVVLGLQSWVAHNAAACRELAVEETDPQLRQNLLEMAEMNEKLVSEPPATFREACQWMVWYQMAARMYNGSGSLGRLDVLLTPYYERDTAAGILTDDEAAFHIACLLLRDTGYIQIGGPNAAGEDVTNRVSYLVLDAIEGLNVPNNVGVSVGEEVDSGLLRRGVEMQFQLKNGMPKFLGVENIAEGFARNGQGYPLELGRERAYSGCHWFAVPGREYTLNDCVKINFGAVFQVSLHEMLAELNRNGQGEPPSVAALWERFESDLRCAVEWTARALDFHVEHMHKVFPELVLDLMCHGPIERGLDASHYGVEYYNLCLDGAALATVADSFAALEQRIEREGRMTWEELRDHLQNDWAGPEGERARLMMKNIDRYGSGGSLGDAYAERITETFTRLVKEKPTPGGLQMIPGLFSWANTIPMGQELDATPNGRHAGDPISHGANPDPGFRKDGAPSAMAVAIARVQPGYGNSAPMQIEFDPGLAKDEGGLEKVESLIAGHMAMGGTQINMNVMDAEKVLEAHQDPSKYPDLIVRVTGFSAYFSSLSPEFRQLVVDRIINERQS